MKMLVYPGMRAIREYIASCEDGFIPKLYTMEEFIERCVVVPDRVFIDEGSRVLYLYRAIESIDMEKLGFDKNFLSFLRDSHFIFRLFEELYAEKSTVSELLSERLEEISTADIYGDYETHLRLLEELFENYRKILEEEKLIDRITVKEYRLPTKFLSSFESIDIHVEGYLGRFELELLHRVAELCSLRVHFISTPFNRKSVQRLLPEGSEADYAISLDLSKKRIVGRRKVSAPERKGIEIASFDDRIDQCAYILASIERFIEEGADPDRSAVILPDESFADYLRLFDRYRNFNYAMGIPFVQSRYYRMLKDLYEDLSGISEAASMRMERSDLPERFEKIGSFEEFIAFLSELPVSSREEEVVQEALYRFEKYGDLIAGERPLHMLHSWLAELEKLSMDDTERGRVTVMGVLESRGIEFDAVVIADFDEETVPKVSDKDIFLNSAIRRAASIPTRADKENLQKHYYYRLLQNSKRAAICYTDNEERQASRFLFELGLAEAKAASAAYRHIISPDSKIPQHYDEEIRAENIFLKDPRLTPSRLRDATECRRRLYYRYLLRIRPPQEEQEENMGTLIHDALYKAAQKKESFADAADYHSFVMNEIFSNSGNPLIRFDAAVEWEPRLKKFCERDFEKLRENRQIVLEEWCDIELGRFILSAKADRIDLGRNEVRVIDYKSGKNLKRKIAEGDDHQAAFYALWAKEHYPALEIKAIYEDLYESKEIEIESEKSIESLLELIDTLPQEETISYPKTDETHRCIFCDYKTACGR